MYSPEMAELSGPHSSSRVVIWGLYEGRFSDLLQKQKLTQGRTKPFKKKKMKKIQNLKYFCSSMF